MPVYKSHESECSKILDEILSNSLKKGRSSAALEKSQSHIKETSSLNIIKQLFKKWRTRKIVALPR